MYFVEGELCIMNRNLSERMDGTLARIVKSVEKKTRRVKKQKMKTLKPKDPHGYTLAVGVPPPQETPLGRYSLEMPGAKVKSNNLSNDDFKTGMIVSFDKYKYKVIVNAPVITSLSTFPKKGCYVGSPIVPSVFSTYADYARYLWFCERPGEGYVYVSDAECYVPTSCESDCRLKVYVTPCRLGDDGEEIVGRSVALCLPEPVRTPACSPAITDHRSEFTNYAHRSSEINREDRSTEGKMSMDINSMLQYRLGKGCEENEEIQSASTTSLQRGENELRVVSYNVLADAYASQPSAAVYIFPYVDPACLRLNHRVQLVLHELLAYDADVICLQECDMLAYKDFFEPIFRHLGYEGIYTNKDAVVLEGCAMFVRKETLTIVQKVNLSMKEILQDAPHLESVYELRPDLRGVLGDRVGTVAQLALCRDPRSGEKVIVTNTHLYFHPKADFVRVLQADAICQAVERLRKDSQDSDGDGNDENVCKRNAEGDVGVIMCGDLNSNPQSAVIEYLNRSV
jgi:endonuclease/exonuclease/phosphatase family metal-dependent hydrolase